MSLAATSPTTIQLVATILFAFALIHTFSGPFFHHLAMGSPRHAGLWHLVGEVEAVFGLWAMLLVFCMFVMVGSKEAISYLDSREFTEPMFVFAVMVIAGSKPILEMALALVGAISRGLPAPRTHAFYFCLMGLVPLLGSFITEPAAMTLAALLLRDRFFSAGVSTRFKYATVGALFVNISIGGTLTPFAAPAVLMVASKWGWDFAFMLSTFGWKTALAVTLNAALVTLAFRRQLDLLGKDAAAGAPVTTPAPACAISLLLLVGVVVFAHYPELYLGIFIAFLGFAQAYPRHQDRLILREAFMVAFFLAGLVVLGGQQQWWLGPLFRSMTESQVFFGAVALTAITDNAALTYLASLATGLSDGFKYALVAGAVTGGGLTVIANAPNPAGYSILKGSFADDAIRPLGLLVAALPPTIVAVIFYRFL